MLPLYRALENNYSAIDFNRYAQLSQKQSDFLFKLLGLSEELNAQISHLIPQEKKFVFTGTTIYDTSSEVITELHRCALSAYLNPNSDYYIGDEYCVYYKGHPNSSETNAMIKQQFPQLIHLPDNMPMEILYLLGFKPDKMGGFVSTSYLFLNKENIHHLVFLTEKGNETANYLLQTQYHLVELMVELGYLERSQIHYYQDFYH